MQNCWEVVIVQGIFPLLMPTMSRMPRSHPRMASTSLAIHLPRNSVNSLGCSKRRAHNNRGSEDGILAHHSLNRWLVCLTKLTFGHSYLRAHRILDPGLERGALLNISNEFETLFSLYLLVPAISLTRHSLNNNAYLPKTTGTMANLSRASTHATFCLFYGHPVDLI